jgi:ATP-dependent Lon protease
VADIEAVLGPPRFDGPRDVAKRVAKPGIALGLAATAYGGETLYVEVEMVKGKGAVQLTGNIKEVMQESAKAALTWIRAHVSELGLTDAKAESLLNTTDLHIHFPEGATPKDGPSAGVTITTALCSLLTGRLVRHDVAMTGEVSHQEESRKRCSGAQPAVPPTGTGLPTTPPCPAPTEHLAMRCARRT